MAEDRPITPAGRFITNPGALDDARRSGDLWDRMSLDPNAPAPAAPQPAVWRWTGLAFLYWLACMSALEPGNLAGMTDAGARPVWGFELLRLGVAAALGASATPALLWLARRLPVERPLRVGRLATLALALSALAVALILASCVLAALVQRGEIVPTAAEVGRQLSANGVLVLLCLSGFLGLIQLTGRGTAAAAPRPAEGAWPRQLTVRDGGQVIVVDLAQVDWIETQGNYQALHTTEGVRLIRETQGALMTRLDPAMFARIHRRTLVAMDRIERLERLANGDGIVRLTTGAELRLARTHRAALLARLGD